MRNPVGRRTQRGLSQAEVAAALGVSRQTVISIENGRYLPSLPLAFRIARFFGLPVDKMFKPGRVAEAGRWSLHPAAVAPAASIVLAQDILAAIQVMPGGRYWWLWVA